MAIKLTKTGMKDIRTENIDLPQKEEPHKETEQEKKPIPVREAVKHWNEKPEVKDAGVMAISKKTYYAIWIFAVFCLILLATHVIWSNYNVSSGKMQGNLSITNNVEAPTIPVTVNNNATNNYQNNFTIQNQNNNTIIVNENVDDEIAQQIADQAREIINNDTNSS
jgi:hypothetical protein